MQEKKIIITIVLFIMGILPGKGNYFDYQDSKRYFLKVSAKNCTKRNFSTTYSQLYDKGYKYHYSTSCFSSIESSIEGYKFYHLSGTFPASSLLLTTENFYNNFSEREPFEENEADIHSIDLFRAPPNPSDPGELALNDDFRVMLFFVICLLIKKTFFIKSGKYEK